MCLDESNLVKESRLEGDLGGSRRLHYVLKRCLTIPTLCTNYMVLKLIYLNSTLNTLSKIQVKGYLKRG